MEDANLGGTSACKVRGVGEREHRPFGQLQNHAIAPGNLPAASLPTEHLFRSFDFFVLIYEYSHKAGHLLMAKR